MRLNATRLTVFLAVVAGSAAFATSAVAGGGNGNGAAVPPGHGGTPPGQVRKQGTPAAHRKTVHAPKRAADEHAATEPRKHVSAAKPKVAHVAPGRSESTNVSTPSVDTSDASQAHDKVTICHHTGSATNPYVEITIARAGWENGHSKHHDDWILQPGQTCGGASATTAPAATPSTGCSAARPGVLHKTGSTKNPYVLIHPNTHAAHYDKSKHEDDIVLGGSATSGAACAAAAAAPTSACAAAEATGVLHKTGSKKNPYVLIHPNAHAAHYDKSKHEDDIVLGGTTSTAGSCAPSEGTPGSGAPAAGTGGTAGTANATPTAGQVLGAKKRIAAKELASSHSTRNAKPAGGVLAATKRLGTHALAGTLPFTGLPLWGVLLAAIALLGLGLFARNRIATASH